MILIPSNIADTLSQRDKVIIVDRIVARKGKLLLISIMLVKKHSKYEQHVGRKLLSVKTF